MLEAVVVKPVLHLVRPGVLLKGRATLSESVATLSESVLEQALLQVRAQVEQQLAVETER